MSIEKSPDAYRTISEVSKSMDLPQHVLRFWETKFTQIKPMKRGGGRRYYSPRNISLLHGIKHLLYDKGFTIKGVQKIIKEQGTKAVIASMHQNLDADQQEVLSPPPLGEEEIEMKNPADSNTINEFENADESLEPATNPDSKERSRDFKVTSETDSESLPKDLLPESSKETESDKTSAGLLGRLMNNNSKGQETSANNAVLSEKELKRLQETLYELLECKRLLDSNR